MTTPSTEPSTEQKITTARVELADTLDALEDKLNVPKQVSRLSRKARASYEDNPVPWIIGATAAVIVIGGLVAWAIFSDD
jgi:hypothetical protein